VNKSNSRKWKTIFIILSILDGIAISPIIITIFATATTGYWGLVFLAFYPLIIFVIAPLSIISFISVAFYLIKHQPSGKPKLLSYMALVVLSPVLILALIMFFGLLQSVGVNGVAHYFQIHINRLRVFL
jgi:hypothetical protein